LLIAVAAAQRLAEDKQSGALDLIITTPITIPTILAGQWRAIWKKLGGPFLGSLVLYVFLIFGAGPGSAINEQEVRAQHFTVGCFFTLTIADCIAVGWLGMWMGLRVRLVPHGAALCLVTIVLPPAMVAGAFVWNHGLTSADDYIRTNPYWLPTVWLVLGLAGDVGWSFWARGKLLNEFRLAATDRFYRSGVASESVSALSPALDRFVREAGRESAELDSAGSSAGLRLVYKRSIRTLSVLISKG
jgi:hypothetical protein